MQAWIERTGHPRGAVVPLTRLWDLAQRWYAGRGDPGWRGRSADEAQAILESVGLTGPFWRLA